MTRRHRTHAPGRDRWMVSYLDVLTILLIFFLTAAAKTGKTAPPVPASPQASLAPASCTPPTPERVPAVKAPPASTEDAPEPTGSDPALDIVARKLAQEGLDLRGTDQGDRRGLTISLPQAVLFSPGDDRIRAAALPTLEKIAGALSGIPNKVNLAGHADATPIHNRRFRNNWELAAARSLRLMEVLTGHEGIAESRVSISSYGSAEPRSPNDTASGRASNRRVEILILSERAER